MITRTGIALLAVIVGLFPDSSALSQHASDGSVASAFVATFGQSAPVVRRAERPDDRIGSAEKDTLPSANGELILTPLRLVHMSDDHYALLVAEEDKGGCHGCPGAIAIGYLHKGTKGWAPERLWTEFAWIGNSGRPADATTVLAFGSPRMVAVMSSGVWQDQEVTTAWVISLGTDRPVLLGQFPLGGALPADACSVCTPYRFAGTIGPPRHAGRVFSVDYVGWTVERDGQKRPFRIKTEYVRVGNGLVASPAVKLPD